MAVLSVLPLAGCAHARRPTEAQLVARAALDLGCAPTQLRVYEQDGRTRVVDGCGRRLIYVSSCESGVGRQQCTWLVNTSYPPQYVVRHIYRSECVAPSAGLPAASRRPKSAGAWLHVASRGGFCDVIIDGTSYGSTPVGAIAVPAGLVEIGCRQSDGVVQSQRVQARASETTRVRFTVAP